MNHLEHLEQLQGVELGLILAAPSERLVLVEFLSNGGDCVAYWNSSLSHVETWNAQCGCFQASTDEASSLSSIFSGYWEGTTQQIPDYLVLEGVLEHHEMEVLNLAFQLQLQSDLKMSVLLIEENEQAIGHALSWVPMFDWPLPNWRQISEQLLRFDLQVDEASVRAALGLPSGELRSILRRYLLSTSSQSLASLLLSYKEQKLAANGVTIFPAAEVSTAGGLDRLAALFDRLAALLDERAAQYNLSLPKGLLLWGIPGTGKSLSAKLAAKKLGVPLVAVDWGGLISEGIAGEVQFRYLLKLASAIAPCVLFLDDFEKAFGTWDSGSDGGTGRRLAGKFLTWMQEHRDPIMTVATINHIEMLPSELIRRFDYIFSLDLPTNGARYEVFNLHLARYFSDYHFSEEEWFSILSDYRDCTPAEIEQAIRRLAIEAYYNETAGQISALQLLDERQRFTPSSERDVDQLAKIRMRRDLAQPATSPDSSKWKETDHDIFS